MARFGTRSVKRVAYASYPVASIYGNCDRDVLIACYYQIKSWLRDDAAKNLRLYSASTP